MQKISFFTFFLLTTLFLSSNAQKLSSEAKFSLITISEGSAEEEVYTLWGHTVFRLKDPANGIDVCYDYGSFDFNTEGFYIKFLRGTLPYQMATYNFLDFLNYYQTQNRKVSERILNLSQLQEEKLYKFLINNYLPENREYHYRFLYYNCSSRLRDILQKVCGDSLQFSKTVHADSTYRDWIERYSETKKPWTEFGMDLAIGIPVDQKTGSEGAMFLPNNLAMAFDSAKIMHQQKSEPLVLSKAILKQKNHEESIQTSFFTPTKVFLFLLGFMLILTYSQLKDTNFNPLFDKILFSLVGLLGWFISFLWFGTDHIVTERNLNVVWAFPLLFPLVLFLKKKNTTSWLSFFFLAYGITQILLLFSWKFLPQRLHPALIPLDILLAVRAFYIYFKTKNSSI